MEIIYNKLVRDNIINKIIANGETPISHILTEEEFKSELKNKLKEECNEVINATGLDILEELGDTLEVIKYLAQLEGKTLEDVIEISNQKRLKRGGFDKRIFLEKTIDTK